MHVPLPSQLSSLPYSSFFYTFFEYFHLIFCPILPSPLSFLLCSFELPHSTTISPCLLFVSQVSFPARFQLFFVAFLLFCPTHQVTHPCLPKSCSPLILTLLDSLSPSVHHLIFGFTFSAFSFFTIRAILHTTIRCCFAKHSFTIILQSHISFRFFRPHLI